MGAVIEAGHSGHCHGHGAQGAMRQEEGAAIEFDFERQTKPAVRNPAVIAGRPEVVETPYVRHSAASGRASSRIRITLEEELA